MADPNNIPQQAQQLKEEINTPQEVAGKGNDEQMVDADQKMAETNFDKEYEMAQNNENGSGSQSSDPNPVNRKDAEAGGSADNAGTSNTQGKVDNVDSPGDSDPDDYLEMAKEVTQ